MFTLTYDQYNYWLVVVMRLVSGPLILLNTWVTIIFSTFLDIYDGDYASRGGLSIRTYQLVDKLLDEWWYMWLVIYTWLSMREYWWLLWPLFMYRIFGTVVFFATRKRRILMLFPNVFEYVFYFILAATTFPSWRFLLEGPPFWITLAGITGFKLWHEYFIHVKKISFAHVVFGAKREWKPSGKRR